MLLVKTYLAKSKIHGLGVFAGEFIPKETRVWKFAEGFDRAYTLRQFAKLPKPAQEFLQMYGYQIDGDTILFTVDNDRHINHSDNANTYWRAGFIRAARNIPKGTEITNDYRLFDRVMCASFLSPETSWHPNNRL